VVVDLCWITSDEAIKQQKLYFKQDATLSQGQPHDAPYITTVLTPTLPLTLSLSITHNYRPISHYYGQLATTE